MGVGKGVLVTAERNRGWDVNKSERKKLSCVWLNGRREWLDFWNGIIWNDFA